MRIAHLIDNLSVGGAQKLLVTLAEAIGDLEVEMTVVVLRDRPHDAIVAALGQAGIEVIFHPAPRLVHVRRGARLLRYLRQQRFDLVVTHLFQANVLGAWLAPLAGTPALTVLHNVEMPRGQLRAAVWRHAIASRSDGIAACGYAVRDVHADWLRRPCEVLSNPVPIPPVLAADERQRLRRSLTGDEQNKLVVAVGTISPQKAYADLVAAVAGINEPRYPFTLAIAGRGKPEAVEALQRLVAAEGLGDRVRLLGSRDDIPALLQAADVFVSSSHWEGLPVSILEAMAAGLPVVATRVGDNERVVVAGTGTLVPAQKPQELAAALLATLADPQRAAAQGSAARAFVREHHDPLRWARDNVALYREIAAGQRRALRATLTRAP